MRGEILVFITALAVMAAQAPAEDAAALYARSYQLEGSGHHAEAFSVGAEIVAAEDTYDGWLRYGWLAWKAGQIQDAERGYTRALEHAPGSLDARLGLLTVRDHQGRWRHAAELARAVLHDAPEHALARRYLAHALYRLGEYQDAAGLYRGAVRDAPGDGEMALGLALCLLRQGLRDHAEPWLEEAEELLPGDPRVAAAWRELEDAWRVVARLWAYSGTYRNSARFDGYRGLSAQVVATDSPPGATRRP